MNTTKIFLFDIDGTLLLTGGAGQAAFDRVFEQLYGEKYIWTAIKPDGRTDPAIINQLFSARFGRLPTEKEKAVIIRLYNHSMAKELKDAPNFRLMPCARETLEFLSRRGDTALGLATGNFEPSAWNKLKRGGLDGYFAFGGYGSDSEDRYILTQIALERAYQKIGTRPTEIFVVGDSIHDIQCGKKIGAKTIAVCTGSTPREVLQREQPWEILENLSQFSNISKKIF